MRASRRWNGHVRGRSRQRAAGVAVASLVALALAGCGGAGGVPERDHEFHIAVLNDGSVAAEEAAVARFNETSDVKAVLDKVADNSSQYQAYVRSRLGSTAAPDVFMSGGARDIQALVEQGLVLPLDQLVTENPALKDSFLATVFEKEVIGGSAYGIPVRGVEPAFLFYNKAVLADAGVEPATTWEDLLAQVQPLTDSGHLPIALAGRDLWPTQLWFQYLYARHAGSAAVAAGLGGDASVWSSDASRAALSDLADLRDSGAFGPVFDTEGAGAAGTARLMVQGTSAYELMGSRNYEWLKSADPEFVATNLGWTAFPDLADAGGEPGAITGGTGGFYNVSAQTTYSAAIAQFLAQLYSDEFVTDQLALGNLPATTNALAVIQADPQIDDAEKGYLGFVVDLMSKAPVFQSSWDGVVSSDRTSRLQRPMEDFVVDETDADGWIASMTTVTAPEE